MKKLLIMLLLSAFVLMNLASCRKDQDINAETEETEEFEGLTNQGSFTIEMDEDEEGGFGPN